MKKLGIDAVRSKCRDLIAQLASEGWPDDQVIKISIERRDLKTLLDWIDAQERDIEEMEDEMRWGGDMD
jgi:hypothetical protein